MIEQWHHQIRKILGFISQYKIGGYFPLDIFLHVVFSIIIVNFLVWVRISFKWACLILFTLELGKEFYDSFVLESTMTEHVKDIVVTMAYPLTLALIRFLKSK